VGSPAEFWKSSAVPSGATRRVHQHGKAFAGLALRAKSSHSQSRIPGVAHMSASNAMGNGFGRSVSDASRTERLTLRGS